CCGRGDRLAGGAVRDLWSGREGGIAPVEGVGPAPWPGRIAPSVIRLVRRDSAPGNAFPDRVYPVSPRRPAPGKHGGDGSRRRLSHAFHGVPREPPLCHGDGYWFG